MEPADLLHVEASACLPARDDPVEDHQNYRATGTGVDADHAGQAYVQARLFHNLAPGRVFHCFTAVHVTRRKAPLSQGGLNPAPDHKDHVAERANHHGGDLGVVKLDVAALGAVRARGALDHLLGHGGAAATAVNGLCSRMGHTLSIIARPERSGKVPEAFHGQ